MPLITRLTISSWNVQGLFKRNDNERVSKLNDDDFLSHIKSDIVCLLETKADNGDNVSLKGYRLLKHITRPRKGNGIYGGIAVYAKMNIAKGITLIKTNSTEYLWMRLSKTFFNHKMTFIYVACIMLQKIQHLLRNKPMLPQFWKNLKMICQNFLLQVRLCLLEILMHIQTF